MPSLFIVLSEFGLAGIFRSHLRDGGPIEFLAATREQSQETVTDQAGQREWNAQGFSRSQGEANIFQSSEEQRIPEA